jgi:hypothetical protein
MQQEAEKAMQLEKREIERRRQQQVCVHSNFDVEHLNVD